MASHNTLYLDFLLGYVARKLINDPESRKAINQTTSQIKSHLSPILSWLLSTAREITTSIFFGADNSLNSGLYTPGRLAGENLATSIFRKFMEMTVNLAWKGYGYVFVPVTTTIVLLTVGLRFYGLHISIEF